MPTVIIDGVSLEVEPGTSILQACEQLGIEVPRFCYHDKLSVPANCRMCLVQVKGAPKPVASCAMACGDKMEVLTSSELVHKARKGVMEMLLINHPLDCPICDQGGECDLQDQAVGYGFDRSRFEENKRAVKDKELGPLIKTVMTRCINCTRCVRFSEEVAGNDELGQFYRGEHAEIGTYIEAAVASELSGNMIDVCPVGALTSKPYSFKARPWELRKTESVDVMDAMGAAIRVDARGGEVMRILPRLNEDVNEEWISDRTRFAYDGLKRQRLDVPYIRARGALQPVSWDEAFRHAQEKLSGIRGDAIAAVSGDLSAAEEIITLRRWMETLGSQNMECRQRGEVFDVSQTAGWVFNSTIAGIDQADLILLVGTNPRWDAAVLNARIRKRSLTGKCEIYNIGTEHDLTYPVVQLDDNPTVLQQIAEGRHAFAEKLTAAKNPMLILGWSALSRKDGMAVHAAASRISEKYLQRGAWNGFNVLHTQIGLPTA
ncbi:MAG TPA: NADH-quinone oxidoreductase subunit G, partial [Rhodospirillaceae bacterium]|nr:NADH-quinone oxidoreductase subunit G [Rhodospirillaceae bacterium]